MLMSWFMTICFNPDVNLLDQLISLASFSYSCLFIYRKFKGKFLPKELYHDLQSSIQDCFISATLFQKYNATDKLYLYQNGTDLLETLYSIIRCLSHSENCDILELIERVKISFQIDNVYSKNPEWNMPSRTCISTDDHSSALSWTGDLNVNSLVLS
jgi:hypothetical protein